MGSFRSSLLVAVFAATGIAVGTPGSAAGIAAVPGIAPVAGTLLDLDAEGQVTRTPDLATLTAGVVTQAPTAAGAAADNARRMAATLAALRRAGIADRDLRTASLTLQPQYRYADNQPPVVTGYQASNQLIVRFHEIARAGAILDALVSQGVNQIEGPSFSVEHPEPALDEARMQAVATARARAALYARAAGLQVTRIVAITESGGYSPPGPVRPMMMASARMKDAAPDTDIQPGDEKIGVTLHVTFALD